MRRNRSSNDLYVETKLGIMTRTGDWFHTTTDQVKEFVPGLLEKRSFDKLVEEALAWVRSADSLSLTILFILLFLIHPVLAAAIALVFHWLWYRYKSGFVTIFLGKVLKFINSDGYLLIIALIALSILGLQGEYLATALGFIFFFLMKLGLLKRLWDRLHNISSDEIPLNDRVFKMLLIKYAMYENVAPSKVQTMEERIKELVLNRKGGKS